MEGGREEGMKGKMNGEIDFSLASRLLNKAAFTRAILRVGGPLHLTADTQKAVGWRVS